MVGNARLLILINLYFILHALARLLRMVVALALMNVVMSFLVLLLGVMVLMIQGGVKGWQLIRTVLLVIWTVACVASCRLPIVMVDVLVRYRLPMIIRTLWLTIRLSWLLLGELASATVILGLAIGLQLVIVVVWVICLVSVRFILSLVSILVLRVVIWVWIRLRCFLAIVTLLRTVVTVRVRSVCRRVSAGLVFWVVSIVVIKTSVVSVAVVVVV